MSHQKSPTCQFRSSGGIALMKNTILANNIATVAGADWYCETGGGISNLGGYNLIEDLTGCVYTPVAGNITGVDPQLGPLADNGGATQTYALLSGSPAIEQIPSGTSGCGTTYTTDQRGEPRPGNRNQPTNQCEMGAWEAQISDPTAITLSIFGTSSGEERGYLAVIAAVLAIGVAGVIVIRRRK